MVKAGAVFAYTLFGLSWLSWVVMLGGVAGMQSKCGGYLGRSVEIIDKITKASEPGLVEGCDTTGTTAFIWWTTWFSFFLLVLLSVAECGRVQGLYLTKQIFLAMSTVCLMLAADRAHIVADGYEGSLRASAQATMAGQILTMICNLVMLLYFGGEIQELRKPHPGDHNLGKAPLSSDMQVVQMASVSSGPGPSFVPNGSPANPFAV